MKDEWFCKTMGIEFGPMPFDDLAALVQRGNVRPIDPVRNAQSGIWSKAAEVPELARYLPSAPPAKLPPREAQKPAEQRPSANMPVELQPLDRYNCAILIGSDGISVCDLRGCQPLELAGAIMVGHRSREDETPIRFGPFELQISIRERNPATEPVLVAAEPTADSAARLTDVDTDEAEPPAPAPKAKPAARRPAAESETRDAAADMLRRMFMPQPSKSR